MLSSSVGAISIICRWRSTGGSCLSPPIKWAGPDGHHGVEIGASNFRKARMIVGCVTP
jgi:hypothetical protein